MSAADPDAVSTPAHPEDGRVVVANVAPEVDEGRFPAKAVVGQRFEVECDAFSDGHDKIAVVLLYRGPRDRAWREVAMRALGNDRWSGHFGVTETGTYRFSVAAWRDDFSTLLAHAIAKRDAGQKLDVEFSVAQQLLERAADGAADHGRQELQRLVTGFIAAGSDAVGSARRFEMLGSESTKDLLRRCGPRPFLTRYARELQVRVERKAAAFSAWFNRATVAGGVPAGASSV